MRVILSAIAGIGLTGAAVAADMGPLRGTFDQGRTIEPLTYWGGFYAGGFAGSAMTNFEFGTATQSMISHLLRNTVIESELTVSNWPRLTPDDSHSIVFGVFGGYNYQMDEIVVGFEADYTRSNKDMKGTGADAIGRQAGTSDGFNNNIFVSGQSTATLTQYGTLRARIGYTAGMFMPFVTAGIALGQGSVTTSVEVQASGVNADTPPRTYNYNSGVVTQDKRDAWAFGYAAGLGVDVALSSNVFLRGEYQYINFPDFAGTKAHINAVRGAAGIRF
jgi:opacity protein-like surface antigen